MKNQFVEKEKKNIREIHIKGTNITKLVKIIFSAWFGYFEYGSYFMCCISLIIKIWLILISTNLPNHSAKEISKTKICKLLNISGHSHNFLHKLQSFVFFCFFESKFFYLKRKEYLKRSLFSSILESMNKNTILIN